MSSQWRPEIGATRQLCVVIAVCLLALTLLAGSQSVVNAAPATDTPASHQRVFDTPEDAVAALLEAAGSFDIPGLLKILGPEGKDIIVSGEPARDRKRAADFMSKVREKQSIYAPQKGGRAWLIVGYENWPFPVPLVQKAGKWSFDTKAGKQEILARRIGANELDAIGICQGFVEAQRAYALQKRDDGGPNQYAQRVISTPGKRDGLAWRNPDGTWGGPIGEKIATAINQGYTTRAEPYHGYFFKVLKGQGPAAPLGTLDFVVKGLMIGGFALVAAPAEYGVTGLKTFIVSHDGVVYEKDFGPETLEQFKKMERFNPDDSWTAVEEKREPDESAERSAALAYRQLVLNAQVTS